MQVIGYRLLAPAIRVRKSKYTLSSSQMQFSSVLHCYDKMAQHKAFYWYRVPNQFHEAKNDWLVLKNQQIIKPYAKMNEEQCWRFGRADSDEIYCQAATLKLSTWNKNHNLSPCNKGWDSLCFPSTTATEKLTHTTESNSFNSFLGKKEEWGGECMDYLF